MFPYRIAALLVCMGFGVPAMATTVKGRVRNGTTGKPAAGDEVVLLSVAERSLIEVGRGKTDSAGRYAITAVGKAAPKLVRVAHQGVGYQAMAPPGAGTVDVNVYDVARTLDGVTATRNVRLQTGGESLQVIDEIALHNASNPPRALANDRPLEIRLSPEAEILAGAVQIGGGEAVKVKPAPGDRRGEYYFPFPLLPGETRFALAYRLPYSGRAALEPRILYPLKRLVVVLPGSMTFEAESPGMFEAKPDETSAIVQEIASPKPGQSLAFRVSGTGTLAKLPDPHPPAPVGQTVPAHPGKMTASHGEQAVPATRSYPVPGDRRFLLGVAVTLVAGSAIFLGYKRKQLRRLAS